MKHSFKFFSASTMLGALLASNALANPVEDLRKQIEADLDQMVETSSDEVYHNPIVDSDHAFKKQLDAELQPVGLPGDMGWVSPSPYLRYAFAAGELVDVEEFIKNHHYQYAKAQSAFDKQDIMSTEAPRLSEVKSELEASSTILFSARVDEHNASYNFDTGAFDVLNQELYFDGCGEFRLNVDGSCRRLKGTFSASEGYSGANMLPVRLNHPLSFPVPKSQARDVDAVMRDFHSVSVFVVADVASAGMEKTLTADGERSAKMSGDYERMALAMKQMNMPGMVTQEPILSLNLKKAILVDWANNDFYVREFK